MCVCVCVCQCMCAYMHTCMSAYRSYPISTESSPSVHVYNCNSYYFKHYNIILWYSFPSEGTVSDPKQQTQVVELLRDQLIFIRSNRHEMVWRKESEKEERIKQALDGYFDKHAECGTNVLTIERELESLYDTEQLLSSASYLNARKEIGKIKERLQRNSANGGSSSTSEREVLFSKENIYHAMVCCEALAVDLPGDHFKCTGHSLDCFSVSRPDCDVKHNGETHGKFLVAKKRNVYFIAFQSIPQISQWTKYRNLEEG